MCLIRPFVNVGDHHRPEVAGGVRARVLQDVRPDEAVQLQEEPEDRAAVQQVRGEQGRLEDLQDEEEEELTHHEKIIVCCYAHLRIKST